MRVYIETFGCQMNVLDSELAEALLQSAGMEITDREDSADVVLLNTCSVREHAERRVHSRLERLCDEKAAGREVIIGVLGCMAQRIGEELIKLHKGINLLCAPGQLHRLVELITAAMNSSPQIALDPPRKQAKKSTTEAGFIDLLRDPSRTHLPAQAYVRIMRGCDKFCTYCIVPYVRGPEQSRNPDEIIEETKRLIDAGITQITLLGQTVNSYRFEQSGKTIGLADLLERLDNLAGLKRIRFITCYPGGFDRAILQAMRDLPKVCEYLHIPAQSGSDRILKAMGRRYSRADYDRLIDDARQIVGQIGIAGDFIVGFPGESDEDFQASVELIRRTRYKNSYIFKYSPRPGTVAARRFIDDVPPEVKRRRNIELLMVQQEVSLADNRALIGKVVEVLVEGKSPLAKKQNKGLLSEGSSTSDNLVQLTGRTRTDHIVVFDGPENLAGKYVDVEITDATALTLIGRQKSQGEDKKDDSYFKNH